jgi:hypothetical protein
MFIECDFKHRKHVIFMLTFEKREISLLQGFVRSSPDILHVHIKIGRDRS